MRRSERLTASDDNSCSPVPTEDGSSVISALTDSMSETGCDSDDAGDTNGDTDGGGHDIDMSCKLGKTPALEGSYKDLSIELLEYFMIEEPLMSLDQCCCLIQHPHLIKYVLIEPQRRCV